MWWLLVYPQWPLAIPWLLLAATFFVALVGSTAAAFLPAVLASRSGIIRGIHGGNADRIMRWKTWMGIGPAALIILVIIFVYLSNKPPSANIYQSTYLPWAELVRSIGTLIAVVAVAASAPACIWLLGRVQGRLALRLACRDLLCQSLRSIPAIAALGSIIFVATALSVSNRAQSEADISAAESVYPKGSFIFAFDNGLPEDLDDAVSMTQSVIGRSERVDVYRKKSSDFWDSHPH